MLGPLKCNLSRQINVNTPSLIWVSFDHRILSSHPICIPFLLSYKKRVYDLFRSVPFHFNLLLLPGQREMDMESLKLSYCPKEKKACVGWVEEYFKDCLCNLNDGISFGLGLASFICWGVAEIPQIITNFKNKSGHGVSLTFLFTWIVGDIFNLVGCVLEPATLPTQFYTALLYTTTTVALVLQCIYYDHLLQWWNRKDMIRVHLVEEESKTLRPRSFAPSRPTSNTPIQVPRQREYFYYMSARSLARSDTPPCQSHIKAKSGPSAFECNSDSSSEDDTSLAQSPSKKPSSQPRRIPRSGGQAGYGTFLVAFANLPRQSKALTDAVYGKLKGRRILQENGFHQNQNVFGQWLGWFMTAIYMGGRIPQIWLNVKRGSVEGLNPLMFIFAVIANVTYVGSILVRSSEWEKIKANMPWLLDAIACVALDLFIILQYIYYSYVMRKKVRSCIEEYYGDAVEPNKAAVS